LPAIGTTLSGIIITRDRIARLRLTVAACLAQEPPLDELVVVHDGEGDAPELETDGRVPLRRIATGGAGRAAARNAGARAARGDCLLFLDGDVLVQPSFAAAHRAAQRRRPGLVRGRIRELMAAALVNDFAAGAPGFPPLSAQTLLEGRFQPERYRQARSVLERAIEERFLGGRLELPAWLAGSGANFSIAREAWVRLGGQDERFGTTWGCEDLELSWRAVHSDLPLSYASDAVAYHLSHAQPHRWTQHARNLELFTRLHPAPEVLALGHLLGPTGSIDAYLAAIAR
jgi:GT2 family glycosyltransferase